MCGTLALSLQTLKMAALASYVRQSDHVVLIIILLCFMFYFIKYVVPFLCQITSESPEKEGFIELIRRHTLKVLESIETEIQQKHSVTSLSQRTRF